MPDANPEAEESLSKALKLNPGLVDAWNELGECFWKRGKTRDAKNCFENALSHVSYIMYCPPVASTKFLCKTYFHCIFLGTKPSFSSKFVYNF